jgi:tetratricopeptide (TPR) repeat protein
MSIHPSLSLLLIGLLFVLAFGGLSLLRRQGLSMRFAVEGLIVTLVGSALTFFFPLHPLLFLILLYLITVRVRLLTDLGNWFIGRGRPVRALAVFHFALRLWPDAVSRQIVLINRGVAQLKMGRSEDAYDTLREALTREHARLGAKHLAAGYYNLGLACRRTHRDAEAIRRFNEAIEALPASIYARAAQMELTKRPTDQG